ncbi:hypothetical protein RRG08_005461 [Elysia crispata]|uniref:Uncharacterized protein n=1 Tax=Elysia crispata TaxID=231223 RepID=A0AAE0Y0Z6_9GAST|nr:hypothetical protein RRG08_005461 [Elysia crispata]
MEHHFRNCLGANVLDCRSFYALSWNYNGDLSGAPDNHGGDGNLHMHFSTHTLPNRLFLVWGSPRFFSLAPYEHCVQLCYGSIYPSWPSTTVMPKIPSRSILRTEESLS